MSLCSMLTPYHNSRLRKAGYIRYFSTNQLNGTKTYFERQLLSRKTRKTGLVQMLRQVHYFSFANWIKTFGITLKQDYRFTNQFGTSGDD